jgi:hypothetical protein
MPSIYDDANFGQCMYDIHIQGFVSTLDDIHDLGVRTASLDYPIQIKICSHHMLKYDTTIKKHRVFYPQAHNDIQYK